MGRDVIELLDALRIERAHFLGLSLGGFVGQWLGIRAPERIDRLILSNTSSYLGPAAYFDERIASVLQAHDMTETATTFLRNWFPTHLLESGDPVVLQFRSMVQGIDRQGLAGAFAAVRDTDMRRTISLITVPTLVIAGEYDTVTAASHSRELAATIPGAQLRMLPAVHLPNIELPTQYLETVLEFLHPATRGAARD